MVPAVPTTPNPAAGVQASACQPESGPQMSADVAHSESGNRPGSPAGLPVEALDRARDLGASGGPTPTGARRLLPDDRVPRRPELRRSAGATGREHSLGGRRGRARCDRAVVRLDRNVISGQPGGGVDADSRPRHLDPGMRPVVEHRPGVQVPLVLLEHGLRVGVRARPGPDAASRAIASSPVVWAAHSRIRCTGASGGSIGRSIGGSTSG